MIKRAIILGDYDTAAQGWTLAAWQLSPAEQKTNFVDKPGGDGAWDLSTALTDGVPVYNNRTLTVTLERSDADRLTREAAISAMVNALDGMRVNIELPDDADHYITGRVHVAPEYNDMAHAAVTVTATCEPWRYSKTTNGPRLTLDEDARVWDITNNGHRAAVPTLELIAESGSAAEITLTGYSVSYSQTLTAGVYQLPALRVKPGELLRVKVQGTPGAVAAMYIREAVL